MSFPVGYALYFFCVWIVEIFQFSNINRFIEIFWYLTVLNIYAFVEFYNSLYIYFFKYFQFQRNTRILLVSGMSIKDLNERLVLYFITKSYWLFRDFIFTRGNENIQFGRIDKTLNNDLLFNCRGTYILFNHSRC